MREQRLRTMMPCANGNVIHIQDARHIVRMNSLNVEGDNAAVAVRIRIAGPVFASERRKLATKEKMR